MHCRHDNYTNYLKYTKHLYKGAICPKNFKSDMLINVNDVTTRFVYH